MDDSAHHNAFISPVLLLVLLAAVVLIGSGVYWMYVAARPGTRRAIVATSTPSQRSALPPSSSQSYPPSPTIAPLPSAGLPPLYPKLPWTTPHVAIIFTADNGLPQVQGEVVTALPQSATRWSDVVSYYQDYFGKDTSWTNYLNANLAGEAGWSNTTGWKRGNQYFIVREEHFQQHGTVTVEHN